MNEIAVVISGSGFALWQFDSFLPSFPFFFWRHKSKENDESTVLKEPQQHPTLLPNIKPRPNLHAQHHNLDTLERLVFEDFNGSPYASKSTIGKQNHNSYWPAHCTVCLHFTVVSGWDAVCCNCSLLRRKLEFIDPRGYINIAWLFIQVSI